MAKSYFTTIVRSCQYLSYSLYHRSTDINHYIISQQWSACSVERLGRSIFFHLCVSLLISVWDWGPSRTTETTYVFGNLGKVDTSTSFSPISSFCVSWFNWLTLITFRYARHSMFMFVVYDVIHRRKAALGYSLLIKLGIWEKSEELICEITNTQLIAIATDI